MTQHISSLTDDLQAAAADDNLEGDVVDDLEGDVVDDLDDLDAEPEVVSAGPPATFVTNVIAVQRSSRRSVRVTLGGGDLTGIDLGGPDQFLYLLLPPPGSDTLTIDSSFTWERYMELPPERRPVGAYYTVRHYRRELDEIDFDVYLHGSGHASTWAAERARVGGQVAVWGPRSAYVPPSDTTAYLLVGDETALPGMLSIVESLPQGTPITALVEVEDEDDEVAFDGRASVMWLHRRGRAAGVESRLPDVVAALDLPAEGLYAWGGGESHLMTRIRRYLRTERRMSRQQVSLVGYWRIT
jgi:NADPH-dependent ferric siderophore reductase